MNLLNLGPVSTAFTCATTFTPSENDRRSTRGTLEKDPRNYKHVKVLWAMQALLCVSSEFAPPTETVVMVPACSPETQPNCHSSSQTSHGHFRQAARFWLTRCPHKQSNATPLNADECAKGNAWQCSSRKPSVIRTTLGLSKVAEVCSCSSSSS